MLKLAPNSSITCMTCDRVANIDIIETGREELRYILCYAKKNSEELSYGTYCNQACLETALEERYGEIGCYVCGKIGGEKSSFSIKCPLNALVLYRCCSTACRIRAMQRCQALNKQANVKCSRCGRSGQFTTRCPRCNITAYCSTGCQTSDNEHSC